MINFQFMLSSNMIFLFFLPARMNLIFCVFMAFWGCKALIFLWINDSPNRVIGTAYTVLNQTAIFASPRFCHRQYGMAVKVHALRLGGLVE